MDSSQEYYDLKALKRSNHRLDRLVDFVAHSNGYRLRKLGSPSKLLPGFNNVTPQLVREFKNEAYAHLKQIQTSREEYGYLFNIIDERDGISHAVYIKYEQFPLMEENTMPEIYAIANKLAEPNTDMHDATCLYLLIFFALLVNRHSNWAIIDYLTNCNSEHPYALYVNWIPKCKKAYVYPPSPEGCLLITRCNS
ncbi:uncharacterized protein TNCT_607691 [Trichonephila clavata]|uniref:Uncharacterized protein n=1 Tax=Trichonephila clavata TaxID=2740835 RepID=A0A8X6G4Z1_TRICU|nr:uncharacterized protein TNCT_607691 [Trichonephila clavata]